jgi:hypothetical protein
VSVGNERVSTWARAAWGSSIKILKQATYLAPLCVAVE